MAFNYGSLLSTASKLLSRFGGDFEYSAVVTGAYNPSTRTQTGATTTVTVKGAFIGPGQTFLDGTVVEVGQGRFLLDAKGLTITPSQGDTVLINTRTYFVDHVKVIDPSGAKVVLYILMLKAGT